MIHVSEVAAMAMMSSLQASGISPDKGLRLKQEEAGFTLNVDSPAEGDVVVWQSQTPLLIVDPETEDSIGEALIDVSLEDGNSRLVLHRGREE